jgi:Protein tyrosine and serine/threonine kinase
MTFELFYLITQQRHDYFGSDIFLTHFVHPIEVANGKDYNEKCDVYSFAILLWQMVAMKTPYELYTMKSLQNRVWNGENKRPFVPDGWPVPIKNLLRRAWSNDISERSSFTQITKILRNECVRIRDGNEDGLEHSRRRSTFVFRGARGQLTSTSTAKQRPSAAAAASASFEMTPEEEDAAEENEAVKVGVEAPSN